MAAYFLRLTGIYWRRRGDEGNRLNFASGTGFIRAMAGASVIMGVESCARAAGRFAALALVALALGACSLFDKDTVVPDEPADKLYNEGLYLLNQKKDYKDAAKKFEEVDRQHPRAGHRCRRVRG